MKKEIKQKKNRIWELDFLRGFLILCMVFDHFMCDLGLMVPGFWGADRLPSWLNNVASFANAYWNSEWKLLLRYIGIILFFMLIGISSKFSRSNIKRGLICTGFGVFWALVMFGVSSVAKINWYSINPILLMLGLSMLTYSGIKILFIKAFKLPEEKWKWVSLIIGLVIAFSGMIVCQCIRTEPIRFGNFTIGFFGQYVPGPWNSDTPLNPSKIPLIYLGFEKWGNDWLGIFPWFGFTFIGGFIGERFYSEKKSIFFRKDPVKNEEFNEKANSKTKAINWVGGKTIWVYLLHQLVLIPIVFIFYWIGSGVWPF